ncbi:MAG: hypothetical protein ACE5HD_09710 [Acidobacteriota bacterium]
MWLLLLSGAPALFCSPPVMAQCAMCALGAEQAGGAPGASLHTLAAGVLVLLVPLQVMVGGIAYLTWRVRGWDGASFERDGEARDSFLLGPTPQDR